MYLLQADCSQILGNFVSIQKVMVNIMLSAKLPVGDACHAAKDLCWCCSNYFLRVSSSDRWLFFLFSMYRWRFASQSHAGWDKEVNRAALRLLNRISTLKVGALGRGARAGPNGEDKSKILCIFCVCCCCHGGVGKKEVVTVAGVKAHLDHPAMLRSHRNSQSGEAGQLCHWGEGRADIPS